MSDEIATEDLERITLLRVVAKEGLKNMTLVQIKRLQILVEKKDYSHNKKAHKSKMRLLAKINAEIYKVEEGSENVGYS